MTPYQYAQYEKKLVEKYITLRAVSENTPPPKSWPITTLATMGQRSHNDWVVACAGARIYRTGTKYMRIIYPRVYIWNVWHLETINICVNI